MLPPCLNSVLEETLETISYDLVSNPGVHVIRMKGEHLLDTPLPRGNYWLRTWICPIPYELYSVAIYGYRHYHK